MGKFGTNQIHARHVSKNKAKKISLLEVTQQQNKFLNGIRYEIVFDVFLLGTGYHFNLRQQNDFL